MPNRDHHRHSAPKDDSLSVATIQLQQFCRASPSNCAFRLWLPVDIDLRAIDELVEVLRLVLLDASVLRTSPAILDNRLDDAILGVEPKSDRSLHDIGNRFQSTSNCSDCARVWVVELGRLGTCKSLCRSTAAISQDEIRNHAGFNYTLILSDVEAGALSCVPQLQGTAFDESKPSLRERSCSVTFRATEFTLDVEPLTCDADEFAYQSSFLI